MFRKLKVSQPRRPRSPPAAAARLLRCRSRLAAPVDAVRQAKVTRHPSAVRTDATTDRWTSTAGHRSHLSITRFSGVVRDVAAPARLQPAACPSQLRSTRRLVPLRNHIGSFGASVARLELPVNHRQRGVHVLHIPQQVVEVRVTSRVSRGEKQGLPGRVPPFSFLANRHPGFWQLFKKACQFTFLERCQNPEYHRGGGGQTALTSHDSIAFTLTAGSAPARRRAAAPRAAAVAWLRIHFVDGLQLLAVPDRPPRTGGRHAPATSRTPPPRGQRRRRPGDAHGGRRLGRQLQDVMARGRPAPRQRHPRGAPSMRTPCPWTL